jgi:hypothetical protein
MVYRWARTWPNIFACISFCCGAFCEVTKLRTRPLRFVPTILVSTESASHISRDTYHRRVCDLSGLGQLAMNT